VPSIDERVVAMAFENQVFEQRVAQTMTTLSKLDTAIKNLGSGTNGFDNLEKAANRVSFQGPTSAIDKLRAKFGTIGQGAQDSFSEVERSGARLTLASPFRAIDSLVNKFAHFGGGDAANAFSDIERASDKVELRGVSSALDNVTNKFSILKGAASVALGNITAMGAQRAGAFVKSFAFGPILDGMHEYETNLGSIQTILSNTQGQQVTGLKNVQKYLGELNTYSDKTIYNFSEMAKNIGTFTAAGVALPEATQSIKGIANLAAASGSSSQQASTAMYQLSQAIAAGRVSLQDWNSVVNAGMGGALFQKALMRTATAMGTVEKGAVKVDKATGHATINGQSFRESITAKPGEKSWLTSDVLTKTLSQFTGDLSDAQLAAQGFSAEQIKAIQATAKTAQAAATQVKTLPQVFDVARETIGSGWGQTFQLIFGDFKESKKTFTDLSNAINGFINRTSKARNDLLKSFDKMGGREKIIEGLKTAFGALEAAIKPIYQAFRDIFPATTAKGLLDLVKGFQHLSEAVRGFFQQHGGELRNIFGGFFAVLHIGVSIVKEAVKFIGGLLGLVANGSGGFFSLASSVGLFLKSVDRAVTQGGVLRGIFTAITSALGGLVDLVKGAGISIGSIFTGANKATGLASAMDSVTKSGGPLGQVATFLSSAWDKVAHIFNRVKDILAPAFDAIGNQAKTLADTLGTAFSTGNFDKTLAVLQTGFLGGILLILRRFRSSLDISLSGGMFDKINTMLGALTGNLKAMQQNLQAKTLFAIAASIGVLVAGIYVLSTIDGKKLASAMTAMAVGMGELVGVMSLLGKMMSGPGRLGFLMMPVIAASMIGLAVAATIMAAAMKIFATMSWEDLAKGLVGVGLALAGVGLAMKTMGPMTLIQGPALITIAIALNILAGAVKQFGEMPWKQMVQGLLGMGFAFVSLAAGLNLMGPSLILTGPGLVAVALGMNMLSGAVAMFGAMKWEDLGKGILGIAGALVALGVGMAFIGPEALIVGPGLIIVAAGMTALSAAIGILGSMKVGTLIKGIAAMGGALVVLGTGLMFMSGSLAGSAALLLAASAFLILGPAIAFMGTLHWSTIISGLAAIAVTLGVLAIAGTVVAAPITALSLALGALGIALTLITAPVYVFAQALALLGASGTKGIGVMIAALTAFVALLPNIVINFLKGLVQIIASIAELAPKVAVAIGTIIDTLLGIVIAAAPKLALAAGTLILSFLTVIDNNAPRLISSGIKLVLSFLSGIANNIGKVVTQAGTVIVGFLNGLANKAPAIVQGGVKALTAFLGGIANGAGRIVASAAGVVLNFLAGLTSQIPKVVPKAIGMVVMFINSVAKKIGDVVAAGVHLIVSFLEGIANGLPRIVGAAVDVATRFIRAVGRQAPRLADAGFKALIDFLHGLAKAIRTNEPEIIKAGIDIAKAIVDGMVDGLGQVGHLVKGALHKIVDALPGFAKKILKIQSPSKVFHEIGSFTMQGFANGIIDSAPLVHMSMAGALKQMVRETGDAKQLGHFLGKDFMDGLTGAMDTRSEAHKRIDDTFKSLKDKLKEETGKIKDQLTNDRQKLKDELGKDHPSQVVVQALAVDIRNNTALLNTAKKATGNLIDQFSGEKKSLVKLAAQYDDVGAKLQAAQQTLDDATRARDDAIKSFTDQYNTLPDIGSLLDDALASAAMTADERTAAERKKQEDADKQSQINQVANYEAAMKAKIEATQKYMATLDQLRALGLDDATYQKLLSEGTKDQGFADQLLKQGKPAIDQINELDKELLDTSTKLAKDAANNLYQAGVDAAQGLVDGLKKRQVDIQGQMDEIAKAMVASIKRQLGIKSPSRVMAEVGKFTAQGVIQGLQMTSQAVANAAAGVGDNAAEALRGSLSQISDVLSSEVDPNLTITPVLDLDQVRKDAQSLGNLTSDASITAATSFGQASSVSQEVSASQKAAADAAAAAPTFNFEQNNYSPESLSDVEIYRQTKNQLGQLKSALGVPT
jgi:tape measure domain-containing protein